MKMKRFHPISFLAGVGVASAVLTERHRLRPVVVEIGALGLSLAHVARAIVERQIEHAEDLWAEVEERVRVKERGGRRRRRRAAPSGNGAARPETPITARN